jgi:prepilin-type processing-associated H-X9-DG protein
MDENLVGYLLNAIDPDTHRRVDDYLRGHPEARGRLELLRGALAPLAADREPVAPPPGLWVNTLARVAEYRCRNLPFAPPPGSRSAVPSRSWWRRPDALVAAAILLVTVSLVSPALQKLRHRHYQVEACKNNLRLFHQAVTAYCDLHNNQLPMVQAEPPCNVAGVFVPILNQAGVLRPEISVSCPSREHRPPACQSLDDLRDVWRTRPDEFYRYSASLTTCYAYSLGYRDEAGRLHGLRRDPGQSHQDFLPILADRPPFDQRDPAVTDGNSRNHGGDGQNVLYLDGHARFCTTRTVGVGGDDIYVNRRRQVAAGLDRDDTVLAASAARPDPFPSQP